MSGVNERGVEETDWQTPELPLDEDRVLVLDADDPRQQVIA